MKRSAYVEGDRVVWRAFGKLYHGTVTHVTKYNFMKGTGAYRVLFEDGSSHPCVYAFELEPENPLETLARCR